MRSIRCRLDVEDESNGPAHNSEKGPAQNFRSHRTSDYRETSSTQPPKLDGPRAFPGYENELLQDAFLATGLLQHNNGRNKVNPDEQIHNHETALHS